MKGFMLILSVVMNGGNGTPGGSAIEIPPMVYSSLADCQRDAQAFLEADGSWNNHRAVCIGKGATVAVARR